MRRKVIRQKDSFTVTLPIKWAKAHGIEESREIDMEEEKEGLFIRAWGTKRREGEVTISSENEKFVEYILNNAYRNGFDILTVNIQSKKVADIIDEHVDLLLGWQITERSQNRLKLENLTEPRTEKFDVLLRRAFFIIKNDLGLIKEGMEKGKLDSETIRKNAEEMIKIDNFCRRCIGKRAVEKDKIHFYWGFVSTVTWVHRSIFYFSKSMKKCAEKDKRSISLLEKVMTAFNMLYEGFYEADMKKVAQVFDITKEIQGMRQSLFSSKGNHLAYYYISEMARLTNLSCSPCIGILE